MQKNRKTKIIATVGPAINNIESLKNLINAGVNVFRLNFSHGSHEEHLSNINMIRQAADEVNIPVGVLQDLSGPKIRITPIKDETQPLVRGGDVILRQSKTELSDHNVIYSALVNPAEILEAGHTVLIADGALVLQVTNVSNNEVKCLITKGGNLRSRVGLAFPDAEINLPATTEKDMIDFEWGLQNKVDFIAISFVQNAEDIRRLTSKLEHLSNVDRPLIVAKIEMKKALSNIDEILEATDVVMVARGDLGVELPVEKLPSIQKMLIAKSNALGKPVIVATQMLHSMVNSNRPTRAEVTDVATAVNTGADAVMLSEETAIGAYPIESVEYLDKIAREAEHEFNFDIYKLRFDKKSFNQSIPDAIGYASCAAAYSLNAAAIIACTETGFSSKLIAKYRPQQPLYGVSYREPSLRRMCLYWGVTPIRMEASLSHGDEINTALAVIKKRESLTATDIAIITGGLMVHVPGATSVLEIRNFGSIE